MLSNVLLKTLRDKRRSMLFWGMGLVAMAVIIMSFLPIITAESEAIEAYRDYKATGRINHFITEMVNICVKSIEEDGVDVIVLVCGGIKCMEEVFESELAKKGYSIDSGYRKLNEKLEKEGKNTTFRIAHMGDLTLDEIKELTNELEKYF